MSLEQDSDDTTVISGGADIISAGAVANYVVCPEAWRLEREQSFKSSGLGGRAAEGRRLHRRWAHNVDEAHALVVGVRILLYLLIGAVLTLLLVSS